MGGFERKPDDEHTHDKASEHPGGERDAKVDAWVQEAQRDPSAMMGPGLTPKEAEQAAAAVAHWVTPENATKAPPVIPRAKQAQRPDAAMPTEGFGGDFAKDAMVAFQLDPRGDGIGGSDVFGGGGGKPPPGGVSPPWGGGGDPWGDGDDEPTAEGEGEGDEDAGGDDGEPDDDESSRGAD